jgi:predicted  nucleic acid-binding Zn-ribbon protein
MGREKQSHILYLSLSELVWTALMVLILVFAFYQNKADMEREKQQAAINASQARVKQLEKENKTLEKVQSELDQAKAANEKLQKDNDDLDRRVQELAAANQVLEQKLAGMPLDVVKLLQSERDKNHDLVAKNAELNEQMVALKEENEKLKTDKSRLEERLQTLIAENESLQKDRDNWRNKYAASEAVRDTNQEEAQKVVEDLMSKLENAKSRIGDLEAINQELRNQVDAFERDQTAKVLQEEVDTLKKEKAELEASIEEIRKEKGSVSIDMIDIKGKLENVACIVDCSSSMLYEKKWDVTKKLIGTWISNLPIKKLLLITYNENVTLYKDDYIGVDDPNLLACLDYLENKIRPQGYSDTYAALKKAYEYKPDTIILFTDGSPNRTDKTISKNLDVEEMKKIEELVAEKQNREIPINIIGFGDYFSQSIGNHIRRVTDLTEGTFIGR